MVCWPVLSVALSTSSRGPGAAVVETLSVTDQRSLPRVVNARVIDAPFGADHFRFTPLTPSAGLISLPAGGSLSLLGGGGGSWGFAGPSLAVMIWTLFWLARPQLQARRLYSPQDAGLSWNVLCWS